MADDAGRAEPPEAADDLDAAARALFALGRTFARQSVRDQLRGSSGRAVELSRVLIVQAVDEGTGAPDESWGTWGDQGESRPEGGEVTVGTVADRLGIDPSTASRLVADATREGYLARSSSARDGRRSCLTLTEAGRELVRASRQFQRQAFLEATADWTAAERAEFGRLFVRFAATVAGRHAALSD